MKKFLSILILLVIVLTIVIIFSPIQSKNNHDFIEESSIVWGGNTYFNKEYNFEIIPPVGWKTDKDDVLNRRHNVIVDFYHLGVDLSRNIYINKYKKDSSSDLDNFVYQYLGLFNKPIDTYGFMVNFVLISKEKTTNVAGDYYLIEGTLNLDSKNIFGHELLLIRQSDDGDFFVVTGETSEPDWIANKLIIKDSLLTFNPLDVLDKLHNK